MRPSSENARCRAVAVEFDARAALVVRILLVGDALLETGPA